MLFISMSLGSAPTFISNMLSLRRTSPTFPHDQSSSSSSTLSAHLLSNLTSSMRLPGLVLSASFYLDRQMDYPTRCGSSANASADAHDELFACRDSFRNLHALPPIPPSLKPPMRFSIIYALYSQECLQHTFHSNGSYRLGSSDNIYTYITLYYYIIKYLTPHNP